MKSIDERFKDASPVETVNNIIRMFNDAGLSVTEVWKDSGLSNCYSLRATIDGTELGTNGKGITRELARASAYAELIERFQSGHLGIGDIEYSDEKKFTKEELLQNYEAVLEEMCKGINFFEGTKLTVKELIDLCGVIAGEEDELSCIPFYDALNDSKVYIPNKFIRKLYSSNGLAAGNSPQEAIVQGFSEIVERHCQSTIHVNRLTPPDVPEEYLKRFSTAYNTIQEIRQAGYEVIIKDCSLGDGYPVVATVILNKRDHNYHVNLGSNPVFEIALERSLTEIFQGCDINTVCRINGITAKGSSKRTMARNLVMARRNGPGNYPAEFFGNKASYDFVEPVDYSNCTNSQLIEVVKDYARKKGCRILLRDLSHLGFNTYRIIVPGMSEVYYGNFVSSIPIWRILSDVKDVRGDITKATFDQVYMFNSALKYMLSNGPDILYSKFINVPLVRGAKDVFLGYMFLAYCEWECMNFPGAYGYARTAVATKVNDKDKAYDQALLFLKEYLDAGYTLSDALLLVGKLYEEDIVEELRGVYEQGKNPFARFIIPCAPENCRECKYAQTCLKASRERVIPILQKYVSAFDNEAAFNELKGVFNS